jgi:hypothetical protein
MGELELRGVAMAITTFAHTWAGCMILCITDNAEAHCAQQKILAHAKDEASDQLHWTHCSRAPSHHPIPLREA